MTRRCKTEKKVARRGDAPPPAGARTTIDFGLRAGSASGRSAEGRVVGSLPERDVSALARWGPEDAQQVSETLRRSPMTARERPHAALDEVRELSGRE